MAVTEALCAFLLSISPAAAKAAGCPDPRVERKAPPREAPAPPPRPGAVGRIAAGHILHWASADVPFASQRGYSAQVLGTHPSARTIPESGIHGSTLADGETLRFGRVADPTNPKRMALAFRIAPTDPDTSGGKRTELSFPPTIEMDRVYWVALRVFVYDWGDEDAPALFGTQMHAGDARTGLSPSFAIYTRGARHFQIQTRYSVSPAPSQKNSVTVRHGVHPIAFERWTDFVIRFRHGLDGSGFLQAWMNGRQIVDYRGHLGYDTGQRAYAKFGIYSWAAFSVPRAVLLHNPTVVLDPTGDTYDAAALRAHVQ